MFKDWLDKLNKAGKDKPEEKADTPVNETPAQEPVTETEEERIARKKQEAEEKFERTVEAIRMGQKGVDAAKGIAGKAGETIGAATDKIKGMIGRRGEETPATEAETPEAEKQKGPGLFARTKGMLGGAFGTAKNKAAEGAKAAGEKIEEIKKDNAKKPSTGSSLLDMLAPAVPETEATKPKELKKPEEPKP